MERQDQALLVDRQEERQTVQQVQLSPGPAAPSVSSSPSHDFSFTISLHPSGPEPVIIPDKNKRSPFAIDLSPADDIFFHGHLLPLHLLSHLPVSPRSSTNSLESFTLPIDKLLEYNNDDNNNNNINYTKVKDDHHARMDPKENSLVEEKVRKRRMRKSKFLSLFGLPRWRKAREDEEGEDTKSKLDIRQVVKRYMTLVKPFLGLIMNRRGNARLHRRHHHEQQQQPYSFSGNLLTRGKKELRGRRGEYSAPASIKTSRTNSGLFVTSGSVTPTKSDSSMEELQAAIQAAIAHCKNTLSSEEHQIKLP